MHSRRRTYVRAVFVLGALAAVVACSDAREGTLAGPSADAGDAETSSSPVDAGSSPVDAGREDADAARPEERVECKVSPCVTALAARGGAHVCALFADKTVACWGADDKGQLGRGSPDGGSDPDHPNHGAHPERVVGVAGATQLTAVGSGTSGTSCARLEDGTVMCWGANGHGQLAPVDGTALFDDASHPTPVPIAGLTSVVRIDVTAGFACATKPNASERHDGELECWGWNSVLQLGRGYLPKTHGGIEKVSLGFRTVIAASGTLRNAFAISNDGELLSWGGSAWDVGGNKPVRDALGRESTLSPDGIPTPIPGLSKVTSVSASEQHACAVADGKVYCWGKNPTGAVGTGSRQDVATPYAVNTGSGQPLREVAVSERTSCARTASGLVYCWGDNADGQLGDGKAAPTLHPVYVEALSGGGVLQVVALDRATCVLLKDGSVKCWGSNANGQLGLGTPDDLPHYTPQKVVF